jgi:dTDP-4-dehydrorhamnose 3,5-epimerase
MLKDSASALYIPRGCAHGFGVLSEQATIFYKLTAAYAPQYEYGIAWNDPALGIDWPIANPIVSSRDAALPRLDEVVQRLAQLAPVW